MIVIRHRTASGRLDRMWEYDAARRLVSLVFRMGAEEPTEVHVPVCAPADPRWQHFPVVRADATTWRLLPERFDEMLVELGGGLLERALMPQPYPIAPRLTRGDMILLTDAPPDVDADLASLTP